MKLVSWNVNGLRSVLQKGFMDYFLSSDADVFCLQEIKLQAGQVDLHLPGYKAYYNYAKRPGYSGTALFSRDEPLSVTYGDDDEGRVIAAEFGDFFVVTCYTPNSQDGLKRLGFRLEWDKAFRAFLKELDAKKPVLVCGDLNVAHKEIDIKNPKSNLRNAGFTIEERESFTNTLESGFVDTFRHFHPDLRDAYSWWSYRFHARERNAGWRIDYWLCSERFVPRLSGSEIDAGVTGSDHAPVVLLVDGDGLAFRE